MQKEYQMGGFFNLIYALKDFFYLTRELELLARWLHAEHTEQTQPFGTLDTQPLSRSNFKSFMEDRQTKSPMVMLNSWTEGKEA